MHVVEQKTPMSNSVLDVSVGEAIPLCDKLLRVVNTVDPGMIDLSLHHMSDFVIDCINVRAVGWP